MLPYEKHPGNSVVVSLLQLILFVLLLVPLLLSLAAMAAYKGQPSSIHSAAKANGKYRDD